MFSQFRDLISVDLKPISRLGCFRQYILFPNTKMPQFCVLENEKEVKNRVSNQINLLKSCTIGLHFYTACLPQARTRCVRSTLPTFDLPVLLVQISKVEKTSLKIGIAGNQTQGSRVCNWSMLTIVLCCPPTIGLQNLQLRLIIYSSSYFILTPLLYQRKGLWGTS